MLDELKKTTETIRKEKFPNAKVIFLAGSFVRGEATSTSDLDLVVVFDQISCAYRESFVYKDWPVEVFVHDPQTLEYFFREVDAPAGIPSLANMVSEAIDIPSSSHFSIELKSLAKAVLNEGPPKWSETDIKNSQYAITDTIEDIKDPRSKHELHASATILYSILANHYFRARNKWSAKGKSIPRKLKAVDPLIAERFLTSFDNVFTKSETQAVIQLAHDILAPDGGFLFQGFKLKAPDSWRIAKDNRDQ